MYRIVSKDNGYYLYRFGYLINKSPLSIHYLRIAARYLWQCNMAPDDDFFRIYISRMKFPA